MFANFPLQHVRIFRQQAAWGFSSAQAFVDFHQATRSRAVHYVFISFASCSQGPFRRKRCSVDRRWIRITTNSLEIWPVVIQIRGRPEVFFFKSGSFQFESARICYVMPVFCVCFAIQGLYCAVLFSLCLRVPKKRFIARSIFVVVCFCFQNRFFFFSTIVVVNYVTMSLPWWKYFSMRWFSPKIIFKQGIIIYPTSIFVCILWIARCLPCLTCCCLFWWNCQWRSYNMTKFNSVSYLSKTVIKQVFRLECM